MSMIPGGSSGGPLGTLEDVVGVIHTIVSDITAAIKDVEGFNFAGAVNALLKHAKHFEGAAGAVGGSLYQWMAANFIGTFYTEMLELGLGVDVSKFDHLAKKGVKTTDTMLAFAYTMPWIVAAASLTGKIPLAGRFIEAALEPISKLPEEMGLSWALGMQVEEAYSAAVGQSIEEGIKQQKRSTRIEWPILRQAYRQHLLTEAELNTWLAKLGYPDEQIAFIKHLDRQQLGVADLQQLFQRGEMDRPAVRDYLRKLGFSEGDVNHLTSLYIDKAETAAGNMYRQIGRALYAEDLITVEHYIGILKETHTPEKEINDDVNAINLQKSTGHIRSSVTSLKSAYQHGENVAAIQAELQSLGYTSQAITDLFAAWDRGPTPHPLSASKVMSYYLSGILTDKADVRARLIATHLRAADADFLIAHPEVTPRARPRPLTPALVQQAYLDGVISEAQLPAQLEKAGATGDVAAYLAQVAQFKKSRQKRPAGATVSLSKAEIVDAWYLGLIGYPDAHNQLMHEGYSDQDATTILEIKNKGPINFGAAPAPFFTSVADAVAYLQGLGYQLTPPPDPRLMAAEQLVESHGWIVQTPAGGLRPPGSAPVTPLPIIPIGPLPPPPQ